MQRVFNTTARSAWRAARVPATRTLSTSTRKFADAHAPPALLGEGAPTGTVPTDENQSTGLERLQLLGHMEGIDVFDMQPLEVTHLGTLKEPIIVKSLDALRQVGCTGYPVDSHDTMWLNLTKEKEIARCSECGSVYKMDFQGVEGGHHH
ncbi:cytochrome c oxidase polypeptide IV [Clavulina sp. PMI_390]|nr:cytochrome c oxidase polypeptide IV [Clavulina sp. PMI_390]